MSVNKNNLDNIFVSSILKKEYSDVVEKKAWGPPPGPPSQIFFISDTHFGHEQIIEYCNRPFSSVEEMDETIIERWNEVVKPYDTVYHLGDVGFRYGKLKSIINRLNGRKFLIRGNHDWNVSKMEKLGFKCLTRFKTDFFVKIIAGRMFHICHRPRDMETALVNEQAYKRVRLCGHEHNNAPIFIKWVRDKGDIARPIMSLNMSCEHWGYEPTHIDKVIEVYDEHIRSHLSKLA